MATALIMLGTIVDAATVKADLEKTIASRKLEYPGSYTECVSYAFEEPAKQKALVLPQGTVIKGDLLLDWSKAFSEKNIVAIVAEGDLTIEGALINENLDGGPFLFVKGDLKAKRIDKGGAYVIVLGDVQASGPVLCEYNHGGLRVAGDLKSEWLLNVDHDVIVFGKTHGGSLNGDEDDLRESLVPEVFADDDPDTIWPECDIIRKRIAAGMPVLKKKT
ncbi:hypothetical protein GC170_01275 [bacterium]|nr:hypothetical protein [bacterium]